MSSDNASFAVTYTSISSDSNGPSWGIPLVNAGELPEMDPYEEVAQQGQAPPLPPAYVPDLIELDEHVPIYVPEPEHLEYHVPSDDDIQDKDQPYADDASSTAESPRHDDDEDLEEDPEEDHIDYLTDGRDGNDEPSDDDDDDDDTDDEDEEPTKDEDDDEEEEEHLAPADSSTVHIVDFVPSARDTEAFETDESAPTPRSPQTRACIAEHAAIPIPPTSPAYDQAPLGHRAAMIRIRDDIPEEDMPTQRRFILTAPPPRGDVAESSAAAARPPRGQYDFVDTVEAGQSLICNPSHDARTIVRAADKVHRRESKDFYTQLHDAQTDCRDIRLKIDVTHITRMEWQRQSVEDRVVRQMMRTHVLEARAQIDTVEDTDSSC
ncbi:hypothetical protein Tco_1394771 [Tanacetum coccineum]